MDNTLGDNLLNQNKKVKSIEKTKLQCVIYPGTFDPITFGHLDIIKRALKITDKIIIALGDNPSKKPLFSLDERYAMITEVTKGFNVEIDHFQGLLVDFAKHKGCNTIIRSMRAVSDFDYEFQMATMNRELDNEIDTIFLMTDQKYLYLHSGLAKEVAQRNGKLSSLVPNIVEKKLMEKYSKK